MLKSILGTKVGMTQIFNEAGNIIPVTIIKAGPCIVTDIRTKEKNGYTALQLGFGDIKEKSVNKPTSGAFKKKNIALKKYLLEFREKDISGFQIGQEVRADIFQAGDFIDVTGVSKGHGFSGTVKRHNFRGGPSTHGQSDRQRAPGSIGSQGPQRVLKGLRMAGHYGNETVTIQKLKIVSVDKEKNYILIKGAVPGPNKGLIVINKTIKTIKIPQIQAVSKKSAKAAKAEVKKEKK